MFVLLQNDIGVPITVKKRKRKKEKLILKREYPRQGN